MNSNKKILFFNVKREKSGSDSPHIGLASLASYFKRK